MNLLVTEQTSPVSPVRELFFSFGFVVARVRIFLVFLFTSDVLFDFPVRERFTCFFGLSTWRARVVRASGLRSDIVCGQSRFTRTDNSASKPFLWPLSAPNSILYVVLPRHSRHDGLVRLTIFLYGLRRLDASLILQTGDWSGKLWRRMWDIGG